jgi:glycine betaine/proline transport system ATP-binding protein
VDQDNKQIGVVPRQRLIGFLGDEQDATPQPCDSPQDKGGEKVTARA